MKIQVTAWDRTYIIKIPNDDLTFEDFMEEIRRLSFLMGFEPETWDKYVEQGEKDE